MLKFSNIHSNSNLKIIFKYKKWYLYKHFFVEMLKSVRPHECSQFINSRLTNDTAFINLVTQSHIQLFPLNMFTSLHVDTVCGIHVAILFFGYKTIHRLTKEAISSTWMNQCHFATSRNQFFPQEVHITGRVQVFISYFYTVYMMVALTLHYDAKLP